jgi:hypothetical protein
MDPVVNERSSCTVTVSFTGEDGNPVVPAQATYRIDDVASGSALRAETDFPELAATVELAISAADNALIDDARSFEQRRLTVKASYGPGGSRQLNEEFRWTVRNLSFIS